MILAVGCEYAPIEGWEGVMPAIRAPSNYKKPEAINGYVEKRLAELRDGKASVDPVVGSISRAAVIDGDDEMLLEFEGPHAGMCALLELSKFAEPIIFGIRLHRAVRLMALDLAMTEGEIPTRAQWAVDLDPTCRYNRDFVDPVSVLFGSSDTDLGAVIRRVNYDPAEVHTALGQAKLALALGGLLGLGG